MCVYIYIHIYIYTYVYIRSILSNLIPDEPLTAMKRAWAIPDLDRVRNRAS